MSRTGDLPADQHHAGSKEQTPTEKVLDKQHGGKHHKMPPVVNPAVDAAFVFHNICLKRAEKQNTDIVTKKIKYGQHQQVNLLDNIQHINQSEYPIEDQPYEHHNPRLDILILHIL